MSAKKSNYYELLGLKPDVSSLEIKRAYRKLVKSLHPDVHYTGQTHVERFHANERMTKLNEAYETLKDRYRRAAYDSLIGANGRGKLPIVAAAIIDPNDSDYARQQYLARVFHPSRHTIGKLLNKYKQQLGVLSQDIYDDQLLENFAHYVDAIEQALTSASQLLSSAETPRSFSAAELMMRYAIAQAADGLDELRRFCQNYDYDHLSMAGNLFREYADLSRKAVQLTK
jgi:molecular chaperone DnaJ